MNIEPEADVAPIFPEDEPRYMLSIAISLLRIATSLEIIAGAYKPRDPVPRDPMTDPDFNRAAKAGAIPGYGSRQHERKNDAE